MCCHCVHTIDHFQYKNLRKIDLNSLKSAAMDVFLGTQARVQNSHGKRAISVRAIEILLYVYNRRPLAGCLSNIFFAERKL